MSDFRNGFTNVAPAAADMSVDAGLRSFMLGVYNKLALGLLVAGGLAYVTGNVPAVQQLFFAQAADGRIGLTLLGMVVQFLPLVLLFGSMFFMKNPTARGVNMLYWAVVASIGAGMGILFLRYTGGSLASTFLVTAAAFGGLSLYGYTTKKDLSAFGTFLIMGLVGLIVASLLNLFFQSGVMELVISIVGVLLFAGLTAYDTQRTKSMYAQVAGTADEGRTVIMSALSLYLDFINMFLFILRIFGSSRS